MITLHVPPAIEREFKARAKSAYPRETFAYVLGTVAGDCVHADELWWPDDVDQRCTDSAVWVQEHWVVEARDAARESGLVVIADIHSHGYTYRESDGVILDRAQSEADITRMGRLKLAGICTVQQVKRNGGKTLRASLRWWGPTLPVKVVRE